MNTQIFDQICQKTSCDLTSIPNGENIAEPITSFTINLSVSPTHNVQADIPIDYNFTLPFTASTVVVYAKRGLIDNSQVVIVSNTPTYPWHPINTAATGSTGGIPLSTIERLCMDEQNTNDNAIIGKFLVTSKYQDTKRLFNNTIELFPSATTSNIFPFGSLVSNQADRVLFYSPELSASASSWPNARPVQEIGLTYNQFPSSSYNEHCLMGLVETYISVFNPAISSQNGYIFGNFPGVNQTTPTVLQSLHLSSPNQLTMRILPLYTADNIKLFTNSYLTVLKVA